MPCRQISDKPSDRMEYRNRFGYSSNAHTHMIIISNQPWPKMEHEIPVYWNSWSLNVRALPKCCHSYRCCHVDRSQISTGLDEMQKYDNMYSRHIRIWKKYPFIMNLKQLVHCIIGLQVIEEKKCSFNFLIFQVFL